jgi:hypothetical protein
MDKNNSYLIISIILGFLITLFYIHKFDTIFLGNFILISFIIYVLFYHLGNKEISENFINPTKEKSDNLEKEPPNNFEKERSNNIEKERSNNIEKERPIIEKKLPNNIEKERPNIEKKLPNNFEKKLPFHEEEHSYHHEEEHPYHHEEEHSEHKKYKYIDDEEEEIKDKTFMQQMEEQEEHIREAQKMEEHQEELLHKMEEEEMHIKHKKPIQHKIPSHDNDGIMKKIMDNINNSKTGINSGIGLGISPVTINLSCGGKLDSSNYDSMKQNRPAQKKCPDINKQSSRIYNNSDWIYNNSYWKNQDDSYNYDDNNSGKLSPCSKGNNDDYLLPCIQPEATKIPQTLNNLLNKRPINNESNVCPMEVNMPWSNYKTGDDKDDNKILEGYSF